MSDNRNLEANQVRREFECVDLPGLTVEQVASFIPIGGSTEFTPIEALVLMLGISVSNHGLENAV